MPYKTAEYKVIVRDRSLTTFEPTHTIADIANAKNIGYSNYLNDVPEAFFTLDQDDPVIELLQGHLGRAHVLIYRTDFNMNLEELVWAGWLGTEMDATENDVIIYAHGYMSALFYLHTGWDQGWTDSTLGPIASDVWMRASTSISMTELKWCSPGTIESPVTTSGGATPIILPLYRTFYKRILFVLRDLADIGRSDTTNNVVFEVTNEGIFNFWKNRGSTKLVTHQYGNEITGFQVTQAPVERRNSAYAVGTSPRDLVLRYETSLAEAGWGRRQEALMLTWVRDATELSRITNLRLKKANREFLQLFLTYAPGSIKPPFNTDSATRQFNLSDKIKIKIDRGTVNINQNMLVTGSQTLVIGGLEHVRLLVEEAFA